MTRALIKNDDVIWRKIEDNIVVITADAQAVYTLNKTAAYIWELCDGTNGIEKIVEQLCEKYEVTREEAESDVRESIRRFTEMGLLGRGTE